ncbi:hypothetical protein REPUB_Repub18cG0098400 [Reevesia pubescens]
MYRSVVGYSFFIISCDFSNSVQIVMYFPSTSRNQRPGRFNVKQAFLFTFTLAVCIWFLYQIKHSNNKKDVGSLPAKFSEKKSVVILGRKGDVELSNKGLYMSDSNGENLEAEGKQQDKGGGDDELDGNVDEKGGNESSDDGIKYSHGDVKINVEEGKTMEPEIPYNLATKSEKIKIEMRDMDNEVFSEDYSQGVENSKRIMSNLDGGGDENDRRKQISSDERQQESSANLVEQGDEKDLGRNTKELQKDDEISIDALKPCKDGETCSSKENGDDKDLVSKEITNQENNTENATILGPNEVANGLHGFHDENGVPQGGNDLVEFTLAKSRDGQANNILHQEIISNLNHPSKITKRLQIEEVASKSERNITDSETEIQGKKQGSKSDAVSPNEIIVHVSPLGPEHYFRIIVVVAVDLLELQKDIAVMWFLLERRNGIAVVGVFCCSVTGLSGCKTQLGFRVYC